MFKGAGQEEIPPISGLPVDRSMALRDAVLSAILRFSKSCCIVKIIFLPLSPLNCERPSWWKSAESSTRTCWYLYEYNMAGIIALGVPDVNLPGFSKEVGLLEVEEEDHSL